MITKSIFIQNLCTPCACRCRYCLLSWNGKTVGIPWERALAFARRFQVWQKEMRPELDMYYGFGYSMEHPDLRGAIRDLRSIGSPQAEFLQCDGMKMRDGAACGNLCAMLAEEGVKHLNFTIYGLPEYHDRFAARAGDFDLVLRMMAAAKDAGLQVSAGIPLTHESAAQAGKVIGILRNRALCDKVSLFVPHEEGRGINLEPVRFSTEDLSLLSEETLSLLNRRIFRPEGEWIRNRAFAEESQRTVIISLRGDNIDRYEAMRPEEILSEIEALDDAYYAAFPTLPELAERYGDPDGKRFFRQRDLFYHYRRLYVKEEGISVYDVTDERQSGSRRY
ncbi:MAG: hypothetical protein IJL72_04365 [Lachnospiraceae bacterium]|nr:hypothetical protein [Lachnospiraceae bacterium]